MKLLFDQNISFRIVAKLDERFKDSKQVRQVGLEDSEDIFIWKFALEEGFNVVTFDSDFYDISLINGCLPKIVWLRGGNKTTLEIAQIITTYHDIIQDFDHKPDQTEKACLEIE